MHLGHPGSTSGPCFTLEDNIHRVRQITLIIKKISSSRIYKSAHIGNRKKYIN
jgi:hypothetical protein